VTGHLLSITDLSPADLTAVLDLAEVAAPPTVLAGRGAGLLFEHPSARTRNASEMAVVGLGGHPVTIRGDEVGFDVRESVEDVARTLASFHAVIAARVAHHGVLERMARALEEAEVGVPVVNLLSDVEHPTQALADLLTVRQALGGLEGRSVAFIGDGNNVARSLAFACAMAGVGFKIASPVGFALSDHDVETARSLGGDIVRCRAPRDAAAGADVLYTDVWVSMGEESARASKRAAFAGYTIDDDLLAVATPDAIVLHCLPAHRGEEVTAAVLDGPRSRIWLQAENRMHSIRGLLLHLFGVTP
jgi:ornithine carbamoyltransferase